jgi:hypothetical protein
MYTPEKFEETMTASSDFSPVSGRATFLGKVSGPESIFPTKCYLCLHLQGYPVKLIVIVG